MNFIITQLEANLGNLAVISLKPAFSEDQIPIYFELGDLECHDLLYADFKSVCQSLVYEFSMKQWLPAFLIYCELSNRIFPTTIIGQIQQTSF